MIDEKSNPGLDEAVAQSIGASVERLIEEAGRLKQLSELQSLKENPVEFSVDKNALLDGIKLSHQKSDNLEGIRDLMDILRLLST